MSGGKLNCFDTFWPIPDRSGSTLGTILHIVEIISMVNKFPSITQFLHRPPFFNRWHFSQDYKVHSNKDYRGSFAAWWSLQRGAGGFHQLQIWWPWSGAASGHGQAWPGPRQIMAKWRVRRSRCAGLGALFGFPVSVSLGLRTSVTDCAPFSWTR